MGLSAYAAAGLLVWAHRQLLGIALRQLQADVGAKAVAGLVTSSCRTYKDYGDCQQDTDSHINTCKPCTKDWQESAREVLRHFKLQVEELRT